MVRVANSVRRTDRVRTLHDGFRALQLALVSSRTKIFHSLILVPCGVFCILAYCFGLEALLRRAGISFPPSVAGLILLLAFLLLSEVVLGNARTKKIVSVVDVPASEDDSAELVGIIRDNASEAPSNALSPPARPATVLGGITAPPPPGETIPPHSSPEVSQNEAFANNISDTYPPPEVPGLSPRVRLWAARISGHMHTAIYVSILLAGIPVYYVTGYAMPAQLGGCVLCYFATLYIPMRYRAYLHPLVVSSGASILIIWTLAAIRKDSLQTALQDFKTGMNFYSLLAVPDKRRAPGAGDMFGAALDAGIVALALPMHQYRRELKEHFLVILLPSLTLAVGSLFAYPVACYAIGIDAQRSLSLASRSLTVALAIPATENLGGDVGAAAAVAVMSGILGVLVGQRMLNWMRIPKDDYITRGITLGANSSAIITALLLQSDPRAAAMSSLSMSLLGTITVSLTSIPPVASVVRSLVL
ncbi:hypothetical protein jhhlp_008832 [Lomentospora prolificans]|uniref:LrgB-like protein n=1 Tax=Lomentospora prolificans TaxID=41688 RepID=A0A2N3MZ49_9PEZI|nr:hypothetical protein jhhlp_008832 [Lomentospora prolificans]